MTFVFLSFKNPCHLHMALDFNAKEYDNIMDEPILQLTHKEYLKVDRNYEKAAEVAKLVYVRDDAPGIQRIRKGDKFLYLFKEKPLKDETQLERIKKLVIPPAWESVWICPLDNGHIQATGFDLRKRKQYRYHQLWSVLRNETKFHRLIEFGKRLPELRLKIESDFAKKEMPLDKVLATLLSVMERTYIRIGNNGYEKMYGSYGLTTLKDKHVAISGDKLRFTFKGKK
ncbi:MAG: DNA topoisomerase IB, partial [Chitinophagaceae bacterium]